MGLLTFGKHARAWTRADGSVGFSVGKSPNKSKKRGKSRKRKPSAAEKLFPFVPKLPGRPW